MTLKNLIIKGNSKMGPEVYIFNLPPKETCTPTYWCLNGRDGKVACYGLRNNFMLPSVVLSLQNRLEASKQEDFVDRMIGELKKKNPTYFRFHSSGDFYSEEYVGKVFDIAKECSNTLFRTTTRRRDLAEPIRELNKLPNFIVRESLDVNRDKPVMGLPFAAMSHMAVSKNDDLYKCVDDCVKCEYSCWKEPVSIFFDEF
ncbi:MAG: hypothetical protein ABIB43_01085 [archaeon]